MKDIPQNFVKKYKKYDLPSADEIMNMRTEEEKDGFVKRLSSAQSSMGEKKMGANKKGDSEKLAELESDKAVFSETKDDINKLWTKMVKQSGSGFGHQRKRNAYKLSKGGSFGHVYIDPAKLRMNRLSAKDIAGNTVMDNVVDSSLIDLLTKRYNPKVEYTPEAKDIFKNLTKFSGLKKSRGSGKQKLLGGAVTLIPPRRYFEVVDPSTWHTTCW